MRPKEDLTSLPDKWYNSILNSIKLELLMLKLKHLYTNGGDHFLMTCGLDG